MFSFNTTEGELYCFLLTRAITKSILDQSDLTVEMSLSIQHNERSSKLISEFQREGLKKQVNFEEKFEGGQITPLGDTPSLVSQAVLALKSENISISLTLVTGQVVGFHVGLVQLQALSLLLEKLSHQAHWQISVLPDFDAELSRSITATSSSQVH